MFWDDQREFYRSKQWKELSAACLKRDGNRCTYKVQGVRCEQTSRLQAHHIIPRSKNGADALFNLTTRCECHHELEHPHLRNKKPSGNIKTNFYVPGASASPLPLRSSMGVAKLQQPVLFKYKATRPPGRKRWR